MASAIALESPDTVLLLDASLKRKVDEVTEDTPTTTESVEATLESPDTVLLDPSNKLLKIPQQQQSQ